jgi:hypothetical protein
MPGSSTPVFLGKPSFSGLLWPLANVAVATKQMQKANMSELRRELPRNPEVDVEFEIGVIDAYSTGMFRFAASSISLAATGVD